MIKDRNKFLEAALKYADLGYRVFPCVPGKKMPLVEGGLHAATTNADCIKRWWEAQPNANVAINCEGLLVVDDDTCGEWLEDEEKIADLHCGAVASTPRMGSHHVFKAPYGMALKNSVGKIKEHVDIRTDGGYILAFPSVTKDGQYSWVPHHGLEDSPNQLPEPPKWLLELVKGEEEEVKAVSEDREGNVIPDGQRNSTLASLAGTMRRVGMSKEEILAALHVANKGRCVPPLSDRDVDKIAWSVSRYEPDQVAVAVAEGHYEQDKLVRQDDFEITSIDAHLENNPSLKPELISGVLRREEIMNLIAAPKVGKSWMILELALSLAMGKPWFNYFNTTKCNVLLIDNELHKETLAHRFKKVINSLGVNIYDFSNQLDIVNLRGKLKDVNYLDSVLRKKTQIKKYDIIIIDAWYRVIPKGFDENDNSGVTMLYNKLDMLAQSISSAFILVHHTSKGNQTGKSVSDVGSGAGSQSRATDTHIVLRKHKEENVVVLDGVVRSNPAIDPICVRRIFPLWEPDASLDPEDLENPNKKSSSKGDKIEPVKFSTESFVECFLSEDPIQEDILNEETGNEGVSKRNVKGFIKSALAKKMIFPWVLEYGLKGYATVKQQAEETTEDVQDISEKRLMVEELLQDSSHMTVKEIACTCGVSIPYVYKIKKLLKE